MGRGELWAGASCGPLLTRSSLPSLPCVAAGCYCLGEASSKQKLFFHDDMNFLFINLLF